MNNFTFLRFKMANQGLELDMLKEDIRVLLKTVLKANKNGWTLKRLDREYKSMVGEAIPFMKFGFCSLKDFLQDFPETVLIEDDEKHFFKTIVQDAEQVKIRKDIQVVTKKFCQICQFVV